MHNKGSGEAIGVAHADRATLRNVLCLNIIPEVAMSVVRTLYERSKCNSKLRLGVG